MRNIHILHLEDSSLDHDLIQRLLHRAGFQFSIARASSRSEFAHLFNEQKWDLVLADHQLPDYDGISALHYVRQTDQDLPFLFVSGVLGEEIAIDTLKSGATDYILKARLERLPSAITRALNERKEREGRRAAEEALDETEHRFEAMANAAPVLIWTVGPNGVRQFFNRLWLNFGGRTLPEELSGEWGDSIHTDDLARWNEIFRSSLTLHEPFTVELRLRRADGQYRWFLMNASSRLGFSGDFLGLIGTSIDLTDIKQTEERLRHVAKLESLGILAGGIAHDFNNLLTGIIGHAELLKNDLPQGDPKASHAENILRAGYSAAQLTRQMLAYSGRGSFIIEQVNLSSLVQQNQILIDASIPRNVHLDLRLEEGLSLIDADPGQVQQVVMNLIINAGEASESNSGTVKVRTYEYLVSGEQDESNLVGDRLHPGLYVALEVSDQGIGMDAITQARIFDPFFTTKFTGRGLGLAAVLGIVRGHRAGIQLRSEPGQGSTFVVLFPQTTRSVCKVGEYSTQEDQAIEPCAVLAVEDEALVQKSIQAALNRNGFTVVSALNGEEALGKLDGSFGLVLLDLVMPGMGGRATLARVRSIYPALRVIGMSGFSELEAIERFGGRLDGFLPKPFTGSQLVSRIREVLTSRSMAS